MKTVIDAANELRADAALGKLKWLNYLGFDSKTGWALCSRNYPDAVCSIEEFDQCVEEMSEAKWIPELKGDIKMITVKEFKDFGGDVVIGDKYKYTAELTGSGTITSIDNELIVGGYDGEDEFTPEWFYDNVFITSFAWRTNTGEKPGFSGLIEWEGLTGSKYINRVDELIWDDGVTKWRPSPNQPKQNTPSNEDNERPVFTQEFAVRGGSSIPLVWKPCVIKYSGSKYVVVVDSDGREYSRKKAKLMTREIDTSTPKQKAVEEAARVIEMKHGSAGHAYKRYCETLYDAGLLKC